SAGQSTGPFHGSRLLLLTSTGAKSGKPHTTPLVYLEDEGRLVVFASKGGAPRHPDWYFNLRAHPEAIVELGPDRIPVVARIAEGPERERLFATQKARVPLFA